MTPTPIIVASSSNISIESLAKTLDSCIKTTNGFTDTIYTNICDGSTHFVANGFWDYAINLILLTVALGLIIGFIVAILND